MEQIILKVRIILARIHNSFIVFLNRCLSLSLIPRAYLKVKELNRYRDQNGNVSLIILCEHLGDIIACEPVSEYLKKQNNSTVVWIVNEKYKEILYLFEAVDKIVSVSCISEYIYMSYFLKTYDVHNLHFDMKECSKYGLFLRNNNTRYHIGNYVKHGSLLETFSATGNLPRLKEKPKLRLDKENRFPELNVPYIVIQIESNEQSRTWMVEKWEELLNSFPEYKFVEVGLKPSLSHISNCDSSYCGKLSIIDIAYIVNSCFAFIGIDSSLAHYANALDKNSIIMLGKYHDYDNYIPYAKYGDNFKIIQCPETVSELPVSRVVREFNMLVSKYE